MAQHSFLLLLFQLAVMLLVGLCGGQIARTLRQPAVIGELLAGICLGPTLFGRLSPLLHAQLFAREPYLLASRDSLLKLGLLFFLFLVGLDVDVTYIFRRSVPILCISFMGIAVPFCLGISLVHLAPMLWRVHSADNPTFMPLFIGTALSISALPVIARILQDLNLLKSEIGVIIIAAASIDDLIGWALFTVVLSLFAGQVQRFTDLALPLALVALLVGFFLSIGRWTGKQFYAKVQTANIDPTVVLCIEMIVLLAAAGLFEYMGAHAIFGAFLVGVALSSQDANARKVHEPIRHVVNGFFAPLYFVSVGLKADFAGAFDPALVSIVFCVACVGKIGGAFIGARLARLPFKQALAVGFGMNARGAMEILLASIALEHKIIDQRIFVTLVIMALLTSIISGPMISRLLKVTAV